MKLFPHQREDIPVLIRDPEKALWHSPGMGKSRIVVDATAAHVRAGLIDTLLVVAPASARSIWADPSPLLGEVARWWPRAIPLTSFEFRNGTALPAATEGLTVVVTNPELVRRDEHLERLEAWLKTRRATYVHDESWNISNPTAQQTKAAVRLAEQCRRKYVLNGTPGKPEKLYSQYRIFGKGRVFPGIQNFWHYRSRYLEMGGYDQREVVGYKNMDEWSARTSPFTILREGRPEGVAEPLRTQIDVTLTPATWKVYQEMRRSLVAELSNRDVAVAPSSAVKIMRLAQVVNGFIGGVEQSDLLWDAGDRPVVETGVREIGREKLDGLRDWLALQWEALPDKVVIFSRFRTDVERTHKAFQASSPSHEVGLLYGGQKESDRHRVKSLFAPGGDTAKAIAVVNAQSGGAGLNLAQAWLCVFLGQEFSLRIRKQAEGRIDRPGQLGRPWFVDVIASGPKGERTVDHTILAAQRADEDVTQWTAGQWKQALSGV